MVSKWARAAVVVGLVSSQTLTTEALFQQNNYDSNMDPFYHNHKHTNAAMQPSDDLPAIPIDYDFQLLSFNDVDLGGEVADIDLTARMSWFDSRFTKFQIPFGKLLYVPMTMVWHPNIFISNQILDNNVKVEVGDCEVDISETCPAGSWHTTRADGSYCSNVKCLVVIRVIAKFGAKPQSFPYDIQQPNLEIKSKNYPNSLVKLSIASLAAERKPGTSGDIRHREVPVEKIKHPLFISNSEWSLESFSASATDSLSWRKTDEDAAQISVSKIKIKFLIQRNTPKLNLTLYVPIFILMVLFLCSIIIPIGSGEKLGFQITLLLASYFYFDFFQDQLPPFEKTTDTPMALVFFTIIILNQFGTIMASIWQQRLETNGWSKPWFQGIVDKMTAGKWLNKQLLREDYLSDEAFRDEQRKRFFNRIDWITLIFTFIFLLIAACVTVVRSVVERSSKMDFFIAQDPDE